MKVTDLTLNEQLRLTPVEIEKRKGLLSISTEEASMMVEWKEVIVGELDLVVEEFYNELVGIDGVPELIGDAESLFRLKNYLRGYLRTLFDGQYDSDYVQSRLRIGLVHKRIGVPPKLYVAAFRILSALLRSRLSSEGGQIGCGNCLQKMEVLEKVMLFDLGLVFDTYIQGLMNELTRSREEIEGYARDLEKTIAERTRELAEQASRDGMTGLYNQRTFFEILHREVARSQRRAEGFVLCYIDLDKFKQANDVHGHRFGDSVLISVANAIHRSLREEDVGARYGGDEFCVLLPRTSALEARTVCDRVMAAYTSTDVSVESGVSMSIGIAEYRPGMDMDADMLIKAADKAMYESKKHEGHYVTVYDFG